MDDVEMYAVVTMAEVTELWGKNPANVLRDNKHYRIRMRKSGHTWLLAYRDCVRAWGQPNQSDKISRRN